MQKLETTPTNPASLKPEDILTPQELAARWKVPTSWVFEQTRARWKARNKDKTPLPCHRVGKYLRFYWPEVCEWLTQIKIDKPI